MPRPNEKKIHGSSSPEKKTLDSKTAKIFGWKFYKERMSFMEFQITQWIFFNFLF